MKYAYLILILATSLLFSGCTSTQTINGTTIVKCSDYGTITDKYKTVDGAFVIEIDNDPSLNHHMTFEDYNKLKIGDHVEKIWGVEGAYFANSVNITIYPDKEYHDACVVNK